MRLFRELPRTADFVAAAQAGRAKRGWYQRSAAAIAHVFGPVDAPRFAATIASLSPQTSVQENLRNTLSAWSAWVSAGRPTECKQIRDVVASALGDASADSMLAWTNNFIRSVTALDPLELLLSGPKVDSFHTNLVGDLHEVTNDGWMASFARMDQSGSPAGGWRASAGPA